MKNSKRTFLSGGDGRDRTRTACVCYPLRPINPELSVCQFRHIPGCDIHYSASTSGGGIANSRTTGTMSLFALRWFTSHIVKVCLRAGHGDGSSMSMILFPVWECGRREKSTHKKPPPGERKTYLFRFLNFSKSSFKASESLIWYLPFITCPSWTGIFPALMCAITVM